MMAMLRSGRDMRQDLAMCKAFQFTAGGRRAYSILRKFTLAAGYAGCGRDRPDNEKAGQRPAFSALHERNYFFIASLAASLAASAGGAISPGLASAAGAAGGAISPGLASAAGGAVSPGLASAAGGGAGAGAGASTFGASAGFGSSFLPQAVKATASIAASRSDCFMRVSLSDGKTSTPCGCADMQRQMRRESEYYQKTRYENVYARQREFSLPFVAI